ncbi:MAG: hypothetical protein ACR2K0_00075 [Acidimicrobiales bacterium]
MSAEPAYLSPTTSEAIGDALVAGAVGCALSGLPSTVNALAHGASPLPAVRAAGTLILAPDASAGALLVAGAAAHTAISFGWALVFALALPGRHTVPAAALAGLAVAGMDLGAIGRRYPCVRALPFRPQVADHLAFGALVGTVIAGRRSSRRDRPRSLAALAPLGRVDRRSGGRQSRLRKH